MVFLLRAFALSGLFSREIHIIRSISFSFFLSFLFSGVSRLMFEQIRSISLVVCENQLQNSDHRVAARELLSFLATLLVVWVL